MLFLLFLLSVSIMAKGEYPVILEFITKETLSEASLKTLRAGIEMGLTQKNYSVIDDKTRAEISKLQKNNCLVNGKKIIKPKALFFFDIIKVGKNKYLFNIKLVDLKTAEIKISVSDIYQNSLGNSKKLLWFSKKLTIYALSKKNKFKLRKIKEK